MMNTGRILAISVASLLVLVSSAPASTLPGLNGAVAAISASRRIGIVTPAHRLRILHATNLTEEFILDMSFSPGGNRIAFAEASAGLPSFLTLLDTRTMEVQGIGRMTSASTTSPTSPMETSSSPAPDVTTANHGGPSRSLATAAISADCSKRKS